jgi:hypothetical protein
MATKIKIGHASISENNTAYGSAGDSTGREVYINDNYDINSLKPNVVLRPKTATLAKRSAEACEAGCKNDNIGYSQTGRNTLYNLAKDNGYNLSTVGLCNTDCSAFVTVCAIAGGSKIAYGSNAPTTTNMRTRFKQSGDYSVLTDSKHLTMTDYLKRGDILVCEGNHTVMVLENGSNYKDESAETEDTTGITHIRKIRTYLLATSITNIKTTSATVKLITTEQINNVEKALSNTDKWTYRLTIKKLPKLETTEYSVTNNKLSLTRLSPGSSYLVQVQAIKADGTTAFSSAPKIFTTEQKNTVSENQKIEFCDKTFSEPLKLIDKVYIKTQDGFKQAVVYNNEQEV